MQVHVLKFSGKDRVKDTKDTKIATACGGAGTKDTKSFIDTPDYKLICRCHDLTESSTCSKEMVGSFKVCSNKVSFFLFFF
jgi:hypothetical protein